MQDYIVCRYNSRGIDIGESPLPCEKCFFELLNGSVKGVKCIDDIHHINPGAKTRQYKKDGTDLLGLCRTHHISQTEDNGSESVQKCLDIAKESIIIFRRMGCKEKLRALVEFLHSKKIDDKINGVHNRTTGNI